MRLAKGEGFSFFAESTSEVSGHTSCFGDCGKISIAGAIDDPLTGGLMVCCEVKCPWLKGEMTKPYGNTMSFGQPHEIYLRALTDTPTGGAA